VAFATIHEQPFLPLHYHGVGNLSGVASADCQKMVQLVFKIVEQTFTMVIAVFPA
jgi:hypothetical protein